MDQLHLHVASVAEGREYIKSFDGEKEHHSLPATEGCVRVTALASLTSPKVILKRADKFQQQS